MLTDGKSSSMCIVGNSSSMLTDGRARQCEKKSRAPPC